MVWFGKEASVAIRPAITFIIGTSPTDLYTLATTTGTAFTGECKDLKINPGEAGIEVLNTFGSQLIDEKRPELVTADFTMVYLDADILKFSFATASTAPAGFERYNGSDTTGARATKAIGFKVTNTSKGTVTALMNNAYITSMGEVSLEADGSAEQTFSAACLLSDYWVEKG